MWPLMAYYCRRLDRFFSYAEFLDDDEEEMSVDTKHLSKAKNIIVLKGLFFFILC